MRKLMFSLMLGCLASILYAQTAPDFTVKDIDGKTHHLYEYLGQNKYVLVDFTAEW